jgi:hypothetical protein
MQAFIGSKLRLIIGISGINDPVPNCCLKGHNVFFSLQSSNGDLCLKTGFLDISIYIKLFLYKGMTRAHSGKQIWKL